MPSACKGLRTVTNLQQHQLSVGGSELRLGENAVQVQIQELEASRRRHAAVKHQSVSKEHQCLA
jgi:hypothetical protein